MPTILWLPIGILALGVLLGAAMGARSTTSSAAGGAAVGAFLSLMAAFPLLAIGLTDL